MHSSIKRTFKAVAAGFAVWALGSAFAQLANAGCADFQPSKKTVSWQTPASFFEGLSLLRASYGGTRGNAMILSACGDLR